MQVQGHPLKSACILVADYYEIMPASSKTGIRNPCSAWNVLRSTQGFVKKTKWSHRIAVDVATNVNQVPSFIVTAEKKPEFVSTTWYKQ